MIKVGALTSSRADFGIYLPLLKQLNNDNQISLEIIAFGTHLQADYGFTLNEIEKYQFPVIHKVLTPVNNSNSEEIAQNIGHTALLFSGFWSTHRFDLVFALGDRYEMFAAVSAATPFNVKFAHIHAGETTLGAIDNAYRHSISLFSKILFVSTDEYKKRAEEIVGVDAEVFNVGALSIDNLKNQELYSIEEFNNLFDINLLKPSILCTFHPETVALEKNETYINELIRAFEELQKEFQIIITMPNSDTLGNIIRDRIMKYALNNERVKTVESFGMKGYLTCMKHSFAMIGNTSSGFVEAAFFPKWVINLGKRQDGRIRTLNILDVPNVEKEEILKAVLKIQNMVLPNDCNIYGKGNASDLILSNIKTHYGLE